MFSEFIIASTLVVNAFAILNFKLKKSDHGFIDQSAVSVAFLATNCILYGMINTVASDIDYDALINKLSNTLEEERAREKDIQKEIATILRKNADLPKQLNLVLGRIRTRLTLAESDASQLGSSLSVTSVLAENVSGKVRQLDISKGRVVDCLQRVDDLLDLRFSTEGVQTALANEDYEQAAAHIHRFLGLDSAVFEMGRGDGTVENSYDILKNAETQLNAIVEEKFDEALQVDDVASMERFFKLFPLLKKHDKGILKFSTYLRTKIAKTAGSNFEVMQNGGQDPNRKNVLYADTITLLFEGIARTIEIHQPIVQTYYGPEKMLDLVVHLQAECDIQAEKILDEFTKARKVALKTKEIDRITRSGGKYNEDPLHLDILLSEITLLHTRAELYLRFVKRRVGADIATLMDDNPIKKEKEEGLKSLLGNMALSCRMQELIGNYIMMEQFYMEESMHKAIAMDTPTEDEAPPTSSCVDDCFFLVRKCTRRALSSSSIDCLCAVLNNACTLIDTQLKPIFKTVLKAGYPQEGSVAEAYATAAAAYQTVVNKRQMPSSTVEGAEKARQMFLLALNNAQSSCECARTLFESLKADVGKHLTGHMTESEKNKVEDCLSQLNDTANQFKEIARYGIDQLISSAVHPRIKLGVDKMLDCSHAPTEAEFNDFEANDPFMQEFIGLVDGMLAALQSSLLPANYQLLISQLSVDIAKQLEKVILQCTFNRLGGLQLDKELRDLNTYLSSVAGWAVREKLSRLSQVSALLNVESEDEVKELWSSANITCRLTPNEVRNILALRIDMPASLARDLKLT